MRAWLAGVAYWTGSGIAAAVAGLALYNVRAYGAVPLGAGLVLAGCIWALGLATRQLLTFF
jgi:hypothetical protein